MRCGHDAPVESCMRANTHIVDRHPRVGQTMWPYTDRRAMRPMSLLSRLARRSSQDVLEIACDGLAAFKRYSCVARGDGFPKVSVFSISCCALFSVASFSHLAPSRSFLTGFQAWRWYQKTLSGSFERKRQLLCGRHHFDSVAAI